jgi:hypothetical protein
VTTGSQAFENSPAAKKLLALLNDPKMASKIGKTLAEVAVELADAYAERDHYKRSFGVVQTEIKQLAGILLLKRPDKRLVITRRELEEIPRHLELHVGAPEDGVRVYELRERTVELPGLGGPMQGTA